MGISVLFLEYDEVFVPVALRVTFHLRIFAVYVMTKRMALW